MEQNLTSRMVFNAYRGETTFLIKFIEKGSSKAVHCLIKNGANIEAKEK